RARAACRPKAARTPRGAGGRLGKRIEEGTENREVGALARGAGYIGGRVSRHPDESMGPEQLARHADADGIEGKMNTVSTRGDCYIDAIGHYQRRTGARANFAKAERQFVEGARGQIFFAELQCDSSGRSGFPRDRQRGFARGDEIAALYDAAIGDEIKSKADARPRRQGGLPYH